METNNPGAASGGPVVDLRARLHAAAIAEAEALRDLDAARRSPRGEAPQFGPLAGEEIVAGGGIAGGAADSVTVAEAVYGQRRAALEAWAVAFGRAQDSARARAREA